MAQFDADMGAIHGMIEDFKGLEERSDQVFKDMVNEGTGILKDHIQEGASQHIETGKMYKGIKKTKARYYAKQNAYIGEVKFTGSEGVYVTKSGKKYDITNWLKAYRIEYGTSKQQAKPFVRPAVDKATPQITSAWQDRFNQEIRKCKNI